MCCFINHCLFCFLIFYLNCFQLIIANKETIELSEPLTCKNDEYFDTTLFACVQCDPNKNLKPSSDRLACVCNKISKQNGIRNGDIVCTSCDSNTTVTIDGKDCVSCNNGICQCIDNEIQIDKKWDGTLLDTMRCLPCVNNTYPSLDRSKCLLCDSFEYNYYINDKDTREYYTWVQDYCSRKNNFSTRSNKSKKYLIVFESQNIDSYYFRNELEPAINFCKEKNKVACEHLSNMCALSLYSNKIACILFMQMQVTPAWLFYNKNETTGIINSRKITQKYSPLKFKNDNLLNFTIATFSLRGNFKSIGTPNMPCNLLEDVQFGINFRKKCKLKTKNLLNANVEFAVPYLTFMKNKKYVMHSLPVLIKNINPDNSEMRHWQLVRKFFFVDTISGYKTISNLINNKMEKDDKISILRYMKSLTVIINVQNVKDKDKIFPPLLIIEYGELTFEQIDKTLEITLDYTVKFTLVDNNIHLYLEVIIGFLTGLALIFSGIKTWNYCKQHHTSFLKVAVLLWLLIYTIGATGNMIVLTLISVCVYLFIFYKSETLPYSLLFDDNTEQTIKILTVIAFLFKLIEVLGFLCQYWNFEIYFLDWEQPKVAYNQFKCESPHNCLHKQHTRKLSKDAYKSPRISSKIIKQKKILQELNKQNDSECSLVFSGNNKCNNNLSSSYLELKDSIQEININSSLNNLPISIWRTYFIANQWLKLQTERKISVIVQLLAVLCIFQITQLYPWIFMSELTVKNSEDDCNLTLYYAVCTLIYVLIYCIQWLLSVTFYERCIKNRMQAFVNLCSITNISVFIFPFNYYGFYIHGRSVHGFADTDLPTLMNDLNKERNNLCAHRGLMPGTTQQTFVLSLSETFKNIFEALPGQTKKSNNFLRKYYFPTINWEQNLNTQLKLKKFLCKFVDHCFTNIDYVIKEQHFIEKLCNVLYHYSEEKSVFYIDNNYSFDHVLFYGNEWLLATFEISIFISIIVLCKNCTLAASATTLVSMLLTAIVKRNRRKNLSNKELLNKEFLI